MAQLLACASLLVCLAATPGRAQLPGTEPLAAEGDLASRMVDSMHGFLDRKTEAAQSSRALSGSPDSARERLRKMLGVVDARVPFEAPELVATLARPSRIAVGPGYEVRAVRWPTLEGMYGEGLLLIPSGPPRARVVAVPDADWSPEVFAGLVPGLPPTAQLARRLAENGCLVLVPTLIDRKDTWSGNPDIRFTNQPHREFIYRMAYVVGRHIIGYEVQKLLAAVDWFERSTPRRPVGVLGYGEGGLLTLYAGAVDPRIDAVAVSGYFRPRQVMSEEPIYRNVWGLLREFGDAEIAGLIAPRTLVLEASQHPEVAGPPPSTKDRSGAAPGAIQTPAAEEVKAEFERAAAYFEKAGPRNRISLAVSGGGRGTPGSSEALSRFLGALGLPAAATQGVPPKPVAAGPDAAARMRHQVEEMVKFTQALVMRSELVRRRFWDRADASSPERWKASTEWYRRYFWEEVIGRLPLADLPYVAKTRVAYDEPRWTGYEVMLPAWEDVFAYGILLVPKNLRAGERRPVVVTQHGLEGRPQDLVRPSSESAERIYARYAAQLADRGFVVYAPQNPYIFGNRFRQLQRKLHPLKLSLFSFIAGQHQRTLDWLVSLPFVDATRIGFYGLSYGGATAVRIPPLLDRYIFSICSANFNEWVWKSVRYDLPGAYLFSVEYEMFEFDFANTFNYAELASLVAPRPFMVERGHRDTVAPDECVEWEYAKVRRRYTLLGLPERTEIEFFDGGHLIHGEGTFRFVHRHLNWPEPSR